MKFKVLSWADCEQVRQWRNKCLYALRTPYFLTEEQQSKFYENVICDRNARARFWGIWEIGEYPGYGGEPQKGEILIGMAGLENIEWENSRAEISLIINPEYHGMGYGTQAFDMLLIKGFNEMHLRQIWGEVYHCNPAKDFWMHMCDKYNAYKAQHKDVKFWGGTYWSSTYFSFEQEAWICHK